MGAFEFETCLLSLLKITDKVNDFYQYATKWHYEKRDQKNTVSEFNTDADAYNFLSQSKDGSIIDGWRLESRDSCHQDGDTYREEKYCNLDGREIVFDGKSIAENNPQIVTDGKLKGTYNYCDPGIKPTVENGKNNPTGWIDYLEKSIGHGICDLIPWYIFGNTREEEVSLSATINRIKESVQP